MCKAATWCNPTGSELSPYGTPSSLSASALTPTHGGAEAENAPWVVALAVKGGWRAQPITDLECPTGRVMVPTVRI